VAIFTKRNALVGYLTLKSYSRARRRLLRREKRSAWKLATLLVLGLVSVGIFAALAAIVLRRQGETQDAGDVDEALEAFASEVDPAADGPVVPTEPLPAT
jgi:hypothetical protein